MMQIALAIKSPMEAAEDGRNVCSMKYTLEAEEGPSLRLEGEYGWVGLKKLTTCDLLSVLLFNFHGLNR